VILLCFGISFQVVFVSFASLRVIFCLLILQRLVIKIRYISRFSPQPLIGDQAGLVMEPATEQVPFSGSYFSRLYGHLKDGQPAWAVQRLGQHIYWLVM